MILKCFHWEEHFKPLVTPPITLETNFGRAPHLIRPLQLSTEEYFKNLYFTGLLF